MNTAKIRVSVTKGAEAVNLLLRQNEFTASKENPPSFRLKPVTGNKPGYSKNERMTSRALSSIFSESSSSFKSAAPSIMQDR